MARSAKVNEPVVISVVLFDGKADRYVRAYVFDDTGVQMQVVDLIHRGLGLYHQTFVPVIAQQYSIVTIVYTEGSYTEEDTDYLREGDVLFVSLHTEADPTAISDAVWNTVLPGNHDLPNTSGLYMQVIRTTVLDTNVEVTSNPTWSLPAIEQKVMNNRLILQGEINANEVKIDNLTLQEASHYAGLIAEHSNTISAISNHDANLNLKANELTQEINENEAKLDALSSQLAALSQQTKFVVIIPQKMTRPETGTKTYQFFVSIYDINGLPEAPDSTPTIQMFDTGGGVFLAEASMSQVGTNIGQYYYDMVLSPGASYPVLRAEFKIIESGNTFYVQRATEIAEYDGDLSGLEAKIDAIDLTTTDNYNLLTGGNGLAQLTSDILINRAEIDVNESKLDLIRAKTDWIITNPVSIVDLNALEVKVDALPSDSDMLGFLNTQTISIKGSGGYNLTNIYDNQRGTDGALLASDPRLAYLDATISSRSTLTVSDIWNFATRTLTEAAPLTEVEVAKIWDYLAANIAAPSSIGVLIKTMLDEPNSARGLTIPQLNSAIAPLALEATLNAVYGAVINENNENEVLLNSIINTLALVKPQTDKIVSGGALESTVISENNQTQAILVGLDLLLDAIKERTDSIPNDPATQSAVTQIPINPLLDDDPRLTYLSNLSYLDVAVSTRAKTSDIPLDYSKEATLVSYGNSILADLGTANLGISLIPNEAYFEGKFDQLNDLDDKLDLMSGSGFNTGLHSLVRIKEGQGSTTPGGGASAQDIWEYTDRQLTSFPDFATTQVVEDSAEAVIDNLTDYRCNMTTTLNTTEDKQDVLCWLDMNNQTIANTENARVVVSDGINDLWSGNSFTPDARGVFRISKTGIASLINQPDKNFVMTVTIELNGQDFTTVQPFYTV